MMKYDKTQIRRVVECIARIVVFLAIACSSIIPSVVHFTTHYDEAHINSKWGG